MADKTGRLASLPAVLIKRMKRTLLILTLLSIHVNHQLLQIVAVLLRHDGLVAVVVIIVKQHREHTI